MYIQSKHLLSFIYLKYLSLLPKQIATGDISNSEKAQFMVTSKLKRYTVFQPISSKGWEYKLRGQTYFFL